MKKFFRKEKLMTSDEFDQIINCNHLIGKKIIFVDKNIFSEKISFNTYSFQLESDDPSQYNIYNLNSLSFSKLYRSFDDENMERSNELCLNYIEKRIDYIETHLYLGKRLLIIFNIELNIIIICSYVNFSHEYNYHTMNIEIVLKYDELDIKEVENVKYEMNNLNNFKDYIINKYIIFSGKEYFILDEKLNNKGITLYFNNNLKEDIHKEGNNNFFDISKIKGYFQLCLLREEKNKINENNNININNNYKIVNNENFSIESRKNNQSNQNDSGISVNNNILINFENNDNNDNNNQFQINNNIGENNENNENNEERENNYNNNLENIGENNNQDEQMEQNNNIEILRNNLINPNPNINRDLRIEPNNDNDDINENLFRNIRENNNNININAENNNFNENINNMQNNIFNQRMENNFNYENTGNMNNIFPNYNINNNQNNNNFNNNQFMRPGPHFYQAPHEYYNPYNNYYNDIPPRNNNNNQYNSNNNNGNWFNGMSGSNHINNSRIIFDNIVDRVNVNFNVGLIVIR